jgi:hypothetical protein
MTDRDEILRRLEAVERMVADVYRHTLPLPRATLTDRTRRDLAEADREIRRGKVVPIHVSARRMGTRKREG